MIVSIFFAADLYAQTGGFAGAYSRMGFGPRGMAMGNSMATVSEQGTFSYYNPAINALTLNRHVNFSTAAMSFDRQLNSVSASFRLPPSAGLQIGILNANVMNFDGRTQSGYHTDNFNTYETQLFVGFGLQLNSKVNFGVNVKGLIANFNENISRSTGVGFDVGVIVTPINRLRLGVSIHDLLSEYRWDTSGIYGDQSGSIRNDKFPTRLRFSGSYRAMGHQLIISTEYEIQLLESNGITEVTTSSVPPRTLISRPSISSSNHLYRAGTAYFLHERITLRGGFEIMDLEEATDSFRPSIGFSVHLPFDKFYPAVDYAFVREQTGISNMHVFALRLQL